MIAAAAGSSDLLLPNYDSAMAMYWCQQLPRCSAGWLVTVAVAHTNTDTMSPAAASTEAASELRAPAATSTESTKRRLKVDEKAIKSRLKVD